MKRVLVFLLAAAMTLTMAGCGGTETEKGKESKSIGEDASASDLEEFTIGVCIPDMTPPFFGRMAEGFKDQAAKYNMKVEIVDAKNDAGTQTGQVENFITEKVDMVILLPVATEALVPAAKELNEAGIPFITDNRALVSEGTAADAGVDMVSYVGSDDYEGGRKQGELLIDMIGKEGKAAIITGVTGSSAQIGRSSGLRDYLKEQGANIEIIAEEDCNWDQTQAMTITENLLTKFAEGQIDAIVNQDPYGTVGCARVIKDAGREDLVGKVIGFDYPQEVYDLIETGDIYGSVIQSPYAQATLGIDVCYKYLTEGGDDIEENTYNELPTVTVDNWKDSEPAW